MAQRVADDRRVRLPRRRARRARLGRRLPGRRRRAVGLRGTGRRRHRLRPPGPGHGGAAPRFGDGAVARACTPTSRSSRRRRTDDRDAAGLGRGGDGGAVHRPRRRRASCAPPRRSPPRPAPTALRDGGNAFDAAVAAALAETVLLPSKCGLGGDLVAIVVAAGRRRARGAARDRRGARGPRRRRRQRSWSDTGPSSVGPPAAPAGLRRPRRARPNLRSTASPAPAIAPRRATASRGPPSTTGSRVASLDLLRTVEPGRHGLPPRRRADRRRRRSCASPAWPRRSTSFVERRRRLPRRSGRRRDRRHRRRPTAASSTRRPRRRPRRVDALPTRSRIAGRTVWATPAPTHGPSLLDAGRRRRAGRRPGRRRTPVVAAAARRRSARANPGRPVGHVDRLGGRP